MPVMKPNQNQTQDDRPLMKTAMNKDKDLDYNTNTKHPKEGSQERPKNESPTSKGIALREEK